MSKYIICLIVLAMVTVSANAESLYLPIQEGVTGSDGWAMWDGSISSTADTARVGYNAEGWSAVTQVYFKIPDALKAPGVVITGADLYMETAFSDAGNTGYGGTYIQLMQYTNGNDSGTVSVAQASALFAGHPLYGNPDELKFERIGSPVFKPTGWAGYDWNVASELQSSITGGQAYLSLAAMTTRSNGTFYANPYQGYGSGPEPANFFNGYQALFWTFEGSGGDPMSRITPHITVTYTPEPATMLLLGLGGLVLRRRHAA